MKKIVWAFDAREDLAEIIAYIKEHSGAKISREILDRIRDKVARTSVFPEGYRVVPELNEIGVSDIREIIEAPWRILFRTSDNEIRIISVVDGRRNIEEILYRKMMEGKLK